MRAGHVLSTLKLNTLVIQFVALVYINVFQRVNVTLKSVKKNIILYSSLRNR